MKKLLFLLLGLVVLSSHDMYLKLDSYFLEPNSAAIIQLYNGTFEQSDNTIDRNRMIDVSLVGNGERIRMNTNQWSEKDGATLLSLKTGEEGTWVAGVSTRPRNIEMEADAFNKYLEHDGVLDMLKWRTENDALDQDAIEKYSKHVKTLFQVGETLSGDWQVQLGYPIEFIPLNNPYELHPGHDLQVELLFKGKPLANQLVYLGTKPTTHSHDHEEAPTHSHAEDGSHTHDHNDDHNHDELVQYRTDENGQLSIPIQHQGVHYLRTIHLAASEEEGLTHESNWATLTFEIGEGHDHGHTHEDDHHHDHEDSFSFIPSWMYWVGSLALFLGLFFWFSKT